MRVAFVQMYCDFGQVERNVLHALELLQSKEADLYILPELFNTGYLFKDREEVMSFAESVPDGPTCKALTNFAKQKKCYISAGLPERSGDKVYNASFLSGPDGFISVYRKIHLFNKEKTCFDHGDIPFTVQNIGEIKVGMMICFDWIFPESMRSLALQGADLICHSANLVMPYCQNAMVTRCLENSVYAVTANRIGSDVRGELQVDFTGASQITGPRGEILVRSSNSREDVQVIEIDPEKARNKQLNPLNNLFTDRHPDLYTF